MEIEILRSPNSYRIPKFQNSQNTNPINTHPHKPQTLSNLSPSSHPTSPLSPPLRAAPNTPRGPLLPPGREQGGRAPSLFSLSNSLFLNLSLSIATLSLSFPWIHGKEPRPAPYPRPRKAPAHDPQENWFFLKKEEKELVRTLVVNDQSYEEFVSIKRNVGFRSTTTVREDYRLARLNRR